MAEAFNPYHQWLDLPPKSVRPNFYELLSLPVGESDAEKIAQAADRALAKVRGVRPGDQAKAWAGLIDELNNAKRLLLDPVRRAEYDAALKRSASLKSSSARPQPAASARPAQQSSAAPKADDPRYPPGVARKSERPKESAQPKPKTAPAAVQPAVPAPLDNALPPGAAVAQPAAAVPQPAAASAGADPMAPAQAPWTGAAPGYAAVPQQPGAPAAYAQPAGYPAQAYPQQPMYPAQPAYPQGSYPQPGYPATNYPPGYAPQPGYPQQPYGYGPQPMASPVATPPAPANFDPMAPVAIPVAQPSAAPVAMPAGFPATPAQGGYPTAAVATPVGSPVAMAAPAGAVPMGQPVEAAAPGPAIGVRTTSAAAVLAANRRREKGMLTLMVVGGVTLAIFAVGGAIAYPYLMGDGGQKVAHNSHSKSSSGAKSDSPPATNFPIGTQAGTPLPNPSGPVPPMGTPAMTPMPTPSQGDGAMSSNPAGGMKPNETMTNIPPAETMPASTPPQPTGVPAPETPPSTPNPPAPEPTTPTPDPAPTPPTPEPPAPMPEMEAPKVTRADLLALSKALKTARAAVSEHNFDEADKQLKAAEKLAKTPELAAMVDRLWQINDMARQFREAVSAAIQSLDAGEVITVGNSTQVAIVETFPDKVIVRIAGQNRTYPIENLPPGLAVSLADMKLDTSDPNNRVIKGAYLLSGKDVNPDALSKAKTWWEEAQLGGVDVSHLMPFLTDDYELKKELAELTKAEKQADE